jgi:23S rRNA (pseudouridine1915-N3)-methyltransferase
MQWRILAVGKPKLGFARAGIEEYSGRLRALTDLKVDFVKPASGETESAALLRRSQGAYRIVLDERGDQVTSRELARRVGQWEQQRIETIAVIIGGAEGHLPELRAEADWLWSLSRLTLQHELALVVALEQLYRAYAIKGGLPYHRE